MCKAIEKRSNIISKVNSAKLSINLFEPKKTKLDLSKYLTNNWKLFEQETETQFSLYG